MTSVRDNLERFSSYEFHNLSPEDTISLKAFEGIEFNAAYWGDKALPIYSLGEAFEKVSAVQNWLDGIETDLYYLKNFVSFHLDDAEGLRDQYRAFLDAEAEIFEQLSAATEASEKSFTDHFAGVATAYLQITTGLSDRLFNAFVDLAAVNSGQLNGMEDALEAAQSGGGLLGDASLPALLFGSATSSSVVSGAQLADLADILQDVFGFVSDVTVLLATPTGNNAWDAADTLLDVSAAISAKVETYLAAFGLDKNMPGVGGFAIALLDGIFDIAKLVQNQMSLNDASEQGTLSEMSQSLANSVGVYAGTLVIESLAAPLFEILDRVSFSNPSLKTWAESGEAIFNTLLDGAQGYIKGDWLATYHSFNILLGDYETTGIQILANSYGDRINELLAMADSISEGGQWDGGDGPTTNPEFAPSLIEGDDANNTLTGSSAPNTIYGYGGYDVIDGRAGNDTIFGGSGTDSIDGGYGNDVIEGNGTLRGGAGADVAVYLGNIDDYRVTQSPDGATSVSSTQHDHQLQDIEILEFVDTGGFGRTVSRIDIGNIHAWQNYVDSFDLGGDRVSREMTYDDGREVVISYEDEIAFI